MGSEEQQDGTNKRPGDAPATVAPGQPDPDTVIAERTFVSPKGRRYRILTTTESDPYDPPYVEPTPPSEDEQPPE